MKFPILPERPLLISPSLAATIGLQEALMLQVLADLLEFREPMALSNSPGLKGVKIAYSELLSLLGFWELKDIKYDPKSNGLMISIDYSEPIPDDNIIGWKSDRNWLYITLLGVKHVNEINPKADPNNLIKELVIDSFDESVQIAILLTKKIHWYDIINSEGNSSAVVFIHTEMKNNLQANLKKHFDKKGKSVFSVISQKGFPTYNTSFQTAFNKAREELGSNAIFRYKGKLYHTNHPGEGSVNIASNIIEEHKAESIDDIFSNYASASEDLKRFDSKPVKDDEKAFQSVDEYFI